MGHTYHKLLIACIWVRVGLPIILSQLQAVLHAVLFKVFVAMLHVYLCKAAQSVDKLSVMKLLQVAVLACAVTFCMAQYEYDYSYGYDFYDNGAVAKIKACIKI